MNEQLKILVAAILDKAMSESTINAQLKQLKIDNLKLNIDINKNNSNFQNQIKQSIKQVQASIDNNPLNIKVVSDMRSIKGLQEQLQVLKNQFKNVDKYASGKLTTNSAGSITGAEIKYFDKDLQQSITQVYRLDEAQEKLVLSQNKLVDNTAKQIDIDAKVARGKAELAKQMDILNAKSQNAGVQLNQENQFEFASKLDSAQTTEDLQEVSHYLKMAKLEYQELNASMTKDLPNNALDNANKKIANMAPAIDVLQSKFQMLGKSIPEGIDKKFDGLKQDLIDIVNTADPQDKINKFNKLSAELQKFNVQLRQIKQEQTKSKFDMNLGVDKIKLDDRIAIWLNKNQRAAKAFGADLAHIQSQISSADRTQLNNLNKQFQNVQASAERLGVTGRTVFGELKNSITKFGSWFLIGGGVAFAVRSFTSAITELKEIDTQLTEISKTSELTTQQLKELGNASFDAANKYGATVIGYLEGVREFSRAGKENAQALAEVSILAQSAGDLTADTANKYLLATDAAYALGGSEEKLTAVLDAQNQVTNRNAVSLEQLAEATMVAGSQAAQSGVDVNELTAAVSTMSIVTQQGGDIAGRAFKGILMNLQQVTGRRSLSLIMILYAPYVQKCA